MRVVVADDHPLFRDGLRNMIGAMPEAELIGEASSGDEAVELALRLRPQVVLMDIQLPGRNGIEATRAITDRAPDVAVLMLTMFEDDDSVFAAMRAGARGYLLKGADHDELIRAIEGVAHGEAIFGPGVARRVMALFAAAPALSRDAQPFPELTDRERDVLELIAQGHANTVIAHRLGIAEKTVRNHVSIVFNKMQVVDRSQAIVRAREAGMGGERASETPASE
ncbi:MAG TPA: response regulator transcription factor [Candidatus Limnocylindria bacterium]|nr:response regulator transcription factor [Candidatus Limnocylindria bacterium]